MNYSLRSSFARSGAGSVFCDAGADYCGTNRRPDWSVGLLQWISFLRSKSSVGMAKTVPYTFGWRCSYSHAFRLAPGVA